MPPRTKSPKTRKSNGVSSNGGKGNGGGKSANLVVVESPAKARTIERILGDSYVVKASQGHVRDLPKGKLGVDVSQGFAPSYSILRDKQSTVKELKTLGAKASRIYLATDPDREGEAISWHLVEAADWPIDSDRLQRVVFHEITHEAVKEAFEHPRPIDMELVNAQQARRILDRLVGYQISPLLWKKVQRGLSAGRVQSVALRLVVDREREVEAFVPKEYWTIDAHLQKSEKSKAERIQSFRAAIHSVKGRRGKLDIPNEVSSKAIEEDLGGAAYSVAQVKKREVKQSPAPPFITSTLQQEAWRKLRFSAKRTMAVAQQLYEGLPIRSEGSTGLITYMRTDSTNVSSTAVQEARQYVREKYGKEYVPAQPRAFRRKAKGAQEAHEAIRPTSIARNPESIKGDLSSDQRRLYDLIWKRMLASQMADARSDSTSVDIEAQCKKADKTYMFRAAGSVLTFPGFRTLYLESSDDAEEEDGKGPLPLLEKDHLLDCLGIEPKQHFTQPPPRYTEASLIKSLEERGIGRPSTYAPIISTITDRHYVLKDSGRLKPTVLGCTVSDLLTQFFPDIMDAGFTARMEEELDEVARGERRWAPMLQDFYGPFEKSLKAADQAMPRVRVEEATDEVCDLCGNPMVIKMGRFGKFMACTGFPDCRNTKPVPAEPVAGQEQGSGQRQEPAEVEPTDETCEKCGKAMVIRSGRFGRFMSCTDYPKCRTSRPLKIGVPCPKCGSDLVQRRSRGRGRTFYGCSAYPACDFVVNQQPLTEPCPECQGLMVASGKNGVKCTVCSWKGDAPEGTLVGAGT